MRRELKKSLVCVFAFGIIAGCAAQKQVVSQQPCPPYAPSAVYEQKTDNFLVILDTSETMADLHNKQVKLQIAKSTIERMNQSIPAIKLNAGLRTYGRGYRLFSIFQTDLIYGIKPYTKDELSCALGKADMAMGNSPMAKALRKACDDIHQLAGTTAVILVSDGKPTDQDVLQAAENMKKVCGDKVCIYTILIGDDVDGKKLMEAIAKVGGCGFSINADALASCEKMAWFVEQVFFRKKCADEDGDGVCDDADKCPGTPRGAKVNSQGCWVIENVLFDFDRADIKPEAYPILDECVAVLKNNPNVKIQIQGHTDGRGTAAYNQRLSERRAAAVKNYFVQKGIKASMLTTAGYGKSRPVASNATDEGRAKNRRVELHAVP